MSNFCVFKRSLFRIKNFLTPRPDWSSFRGRKKLEPRQDAQLCDHRNNAVKESNSARNKFCKKVTVNCQIRSNTYKLYNVVKILSGCRYFPLGLVLANSRFVLSSFL